MGDDHDHDTDGCGCHVPLRPETCCFVMFDVHAEGIATHVNVDMEWWGAASKEMRTTLIGSAEDLPGRIRELAERLGGAN